jgi:hypothetical protein
MTLNRISGSTAAVLTQTVAPDASGDHTFGFHWSTNLPGGQVMEIELTQSVRALAAPLADIALRIHSEGGNVLLAWPTNGSAALRLNGASSIRSDALWTPVTNVPVISGAEFQVPLPRSEPARYFRLQQ